MANYNRLYFQGNQTVGYIQPLDLTTLQIDAVSDYSFGMTVNLEKKQNAVQNDNHCLVSFDFSFGGNQGGAYYVHATDGTLRAFSGNSSYASSAGVFTYFTDQQITFTLTGTTLKGYINGTLVWTQTIARVATSNNSNSFFCQEGVRFRGLLGTMRNIFLTKSLLTQADVTNIQSGVYPSTFTSGFYYKCNEGIGPGLFDSSGSRNHGLVTLNSSVSSSIIGAVWKRYGGSVLT